MQETMDPAFAMSGSELAVTLLDRKTQWRLASYPPLSDSVYTFQVFTSSLK